MRYGFEPKLASMLANAHGVSTMPPELVLPLELRAAEIRRLREFLHAQGTFDFPQLPSGLFPAAVSLYAATDYTGYHHVWVRDNVHVAHALWVTGRREEGIRAMRGLLAFFETQRGRIADILAGRTDPADPANRPHIRFYGDLTESPERWAHAQNDALGYFLWLFGKLAAQGDLAVGEPERELLAGFVLYFGAICYWQDADSGHWEETRKIEASSIGVAVAGLESIRPLWAGGPLAFEGQAVAIEELDQLIARGRSALAQILPSESVQPDSGPRRYDSALLFLVYPTEVVDGELADRIVTDVLTHLAGEHGIRRYLGDSYWCADYKTSLAPEERSTDYSENLDARDALLSPGGEAQWCIFDPIVSAIFGRRFQQHGRAEDLALQRKHLERSLAQLTRQEHPFPPFRCPESYFSERGVYGPNDVTPLLWTQANLLLALDEMERSLANRG